MFTKRHTINNSKRLPLRKVVCACALALLTLEPFAIAQSGATESQGLGSRIEGTWIVTIHRVNQGVTFTALQSFTAGGVTVATGSMDRTPPPPISPLYGSWVHMNDNSYTAAICFFAFDPAGNAVAIIKTPETLHLVDDNNLVGTGSGLACDLNGDHCVDINSPITISGKRLLASN